MQFSICVLIENIKKELAYWIVMLFYICFIGTFKLRLKQMNDYPI